MQPMTDSGKDLPALEPRFLPPEGWRWHSFKTPQGRKIRFWAVAPKSRIPDAVVIGLQGLSEFGEKYFETAHSLLERNLSFWMMDWQGQGHSDRLLKNPQKRHATSFDQDIADLHYFIMEYVKHSAVHPDVGRIPLVMLGHSMGANIGLRYLHRHPDTFACAAFSAPLLDIHALRMLPGALRLSLAEVLNAGFGKSYVFGGKNWNGKRRETISQNRLTSDPIRSKVHNAWCMHDPKLQVGDPTFGFIYAAEKSCAFLKGRNVLEDIKTPILLGLAEHDRIVDNDAIREAAGRLPCAKLLELAGSQHEILMEGDAIRNQFLNGFHELLSHNRVKEKLKTF